MGKSIFETIIEFIDKHGIKEAMLMVVILGTTLGLLLLFKYLWYKIKKAKNNSMTMHQDMLLEHHLFASLKTYLNYEIQHLNINERLRNAIFKDFLIHKFSSIRYEFEYFLKKGDLEKMSPGVYSTRILESVNNIVKKYEQKALQDEIPQIVIDRFNEWHSERIKQTFEVINDVCYDDIYSTNTMKTKIIFDYILVIVNWTIADAKKTLINLNGELNKVTYKGITVDPDYLKKS